MVYLSDIVFRSHKTTSYVDKTLKVLHPKIWNQLPQNIKSGTP